MARTIWILIALVSAIALAGPAAKPVQATPAQQRQINDLQQQMYALQVKGAYFPALRLGKQVLELERRIYGDDSRQVRQRKQGLAGMYTTTGDYAGALAIDKEVLASAERSEGPESRDVQTALMGVSGMLWAQNRLDEAEPYAQRSLAITKKLDGESSLMYASQLTMYAALLQMHNEFSAAERLYEEGLRLQEHLAKSPTDLALIGPIQQLASIYWQTNQRAKATALYDRAIAIAMKSPDANVQTKAGTVWAIASQYHYGGRDDLAKPLFQRSIELYTKEIARLDKDKPDDPMLPVMLGQLGYNYRQIDDLANAAKTFQRVVALDSKKQGYSGWSATLAEILRATGHPKEALAMYEQSEAQLAKVSPISAHAYDTTIADVLRELGEYKRAEKLLLDYRRYAEKTFGKRHPMYGMTEQSLAYLYMASGETGKAEKTLAESLEIAEKELVNVLRTGTESDHAIYFAKNGYQLDTAMNFGIDLCAAQRGGGAARADHAAAPQGPRARCRGREHGDDPLEAVGRGQETARRPRECAHPAREAHRRRPRRDRAGRLREIGRRPRGPDPEARDRGRQEEHRVPGDQPADRARTDPEADPEGCAARRDGELPAQRSQGAVPREPDPAAAPLRRVRARLARRSGADRSRPGDGDRRRGRAVSQGRIEPEEHQGRRARQRAVQAHDRQAGARAWRRDRPVARARRHARRRAVLGARRRSRQAAARRPTRSRT